MLPLLVVSATGLVAVGLIGALLATARTTARIEQQLRGVVEVIAQSNYPLTDSVLRQMAGLANAELLLTDGEGRRLASSDDLRLPDNDWLAATASTIDAVRLGPALSVGSESLMHSSFLLRRAARDEPSRVLHVFFATRDYEAAWQSAFLPPLLVGLSMIGLLAGIVHVTAGRLSRTLAKLGIEVQRLSSGDFSAVEMPAWNDETRDLAGAVNETARRLAEYEAQLRSSERLRTVSVLGAGLAHEMRNAATGCRLAIDLHAARSPAGPEDDSLRVARRQLLVMEDRLREVLLLGKESSALDRHPFDLGDLVTGAAAALEPAAAHAGVLVHSETPAQPIMIRANRELVRLAVSNVMLNGLQASAKACVEKPVAGRVRIRLESIERTALLVISDSGAGPSDTVAERLFDPLCTTKAEGIGLGLAIAKQAVESSNGRIEWARIDGTTEFRIELPLMSEEDCHG